ncbi:RECQ helicase SIM [Wolffia australiana]
MMVIESDSSGDHIIAALMDMGFELPDATLAIKSVGSDLDAAIEFILNGNKAEEDTSTGRMASNTPLTSLKLPPIKIGTSFHNNQHLRQSCISDHLPAAPRPKASLSVSIPRKVNLPIKRSHDGCDEGLKSDFGVPETSAWSARPGEALEIQESTDILSGSEIDTILLQKFGLSSLRNFQRKALEAWICHKDCLILAATGSGKSLCFQIPAFLSQKVTVVISPLISLMRDQCLKLSQRGVSACFLGSGQPDSSIERKAMSGLYDIIYVCPETVLRLVVPLQRLAENRGIALFAIDEAHCVSQWGHDFRPDYRRLSILRENFRACKVKGLKFDVPVMALTATATTRVRKDIIESLLMSDDAEVIITSFFRPNLRFSVKHSRTSNASSYLKDFSELIETYGSGKRSKKRYVYPTDKTDSAYLHPSTCQEPDTKSSIDAYCTFRDYSSDSRSSEEHSANAEASRLCSEQMIAELLEDDLDTGATEFLDGIHQVQSIPHGTVAELNHEMFMSAEQGTTIVYVPTRKEVMKIAEFLCKYGVKAAAYHALLPKSHLRQVHEDFHCGKIQVVVATIAFGMGIDKSDVRRIIHYGWPQSLEAYYQEAGRAGRDGKLSDCVLFANLSKPPMLLPNKRNDEQKRRAYEMLYFCFRYGVNVVSCRSKILVEYFGEEFNQGNCQVCDVCRNGYPVEQNYQGEAKAFLHILAAHYKYVDEGLLPMKDEDIKFRMILSGIREQYKKYSSNERSWWQGLARILIDKGFIKEKGGEIKMLVTHPVPTELGMKFLTSGDDQPLYAYPQADMLIVPQQEHHNKPFSSFSHWANPRLRRQHLLHKYKRG